MQITVGGCFLLIACLYLGIRYRHSYRELFQAFFIFSILSGILLNLGYAGKVGSFEIAYNYILSIVMFFVSLTVLFHTGFDHRMLGWMFIFLAETLVGLLLAMRTSYQSIPFQMNWDPYFGTGTALPIVGVDYKQFILMLGRILLFYINIMAFKKACDRTWILKASSLAFKVTLGVIGVAVLEMILDNAVSPTLFRNAMITFFGNSTATYQIPRQFFGIYMPLLSFTEPSEASFAYFLLAINALFQIYQGKRKASIAVLLILVLLLATGGSLSSAVYLVLILVLACFVLCRSVPKGILVLCLLGIPTGILGFRLFGSRIENIFKYLSSFSQGNTSLPQGSEIVRMFSIYNNLTYFLKSPLLGTGLGTIYSFSGFVTTLTDIGLLGLFVWSACLVSGLDNLHFHKGSLALAFVFFFASFAVTGHMGIMTYLDKSFFLFVILASLGRKEQILFTFEKYKDAILADILDTPEGETTLIRLSN
jgi:hypothetical protein